MTNAQHALMSFESLTLHSTHDRVMATGHQLLVAAGECHPFFRPKYIDRANECFARCGYSRVA